MGPIPTTGLDKSKAAALQAVLDSAVSAGAPDVMAAVISDEGVWTGAAGIGGPDGRRATAADTFAIASVTKTFTAALILRLVEQGRMNLDAPLATYLGDLDVDTNKATVRQALAMESGLPETSTAAAQGIDADPGHAWTVEEIIATFAPPKAAAGSTYIYSNPAFKLLAIAAEHVTGKSFADALRAEVLDPVGADRILHQGQGTSAPKPWALPVPAKMGTYSARDLGKGGALPTLASATFSVGGSSMASDVGSLASWGWHLFSGDIIDADSLGWMVPAGEYEHGLGLDRFRSFGDVLAYGHGGNKPGYASILVVFPAKRIAAAVFINDQDAAPDLVVSRLIEAIDAP